MYHQIHLVSCFSRSNILFWFWIWDLACFASSQHTRGNSKLERQKVNKIQMPTCQYSLRLASAGIEWGRELLLSANQYKRLVIATQRFWDTTAAVQYFATAEKPSGHYEHCCALQVWKPKNEVERTVPGRHMVENLRAHFCNFRGGLKAVNFRNCAQRWTVKNRVLNQETLSLKLNLSRGEMNVQNKELPLWVSEKTFWTFVQLCSILLVRDVGVRGCSRYDRVALAASPSVRGTDRFRGDVLCHWSGIRLLAGQCMI